MQLSDPDLERRINSYLKNGYDRKDVYSSNLHELTIESVRGIRLSSSCASRTKALKTIEEQLIAQRNESCLLPSFGWTARNLL